jgi:hypothetical protein
MKKQSKVPFHASGNRVPGVARDLTERKPKTSEENR